MDIVDVKVGETYLLRKGAGCQAEPHGVHLSKLRVHIRKIEGSSLYYTIINLDNQSQKDCCICIKASDLAPINIKQTIMSDLKEQFALLFTKEPEKSFRKAGVTNSDDQLTADGQTVLLTWLLKANGEKFKTEVIDPILAAQAAEKK